MSWLSRVLYTQDTSNNNVSGVPTMLTSTQMELAIRAVSEIDEQSLLVVTTKMIDDIRTGKYSDGHQLTSRVCVGDLRERINWWHETYYVALVVACASGNLVRLACHAVGVNPCQGEFAQMLTLVGAISNIEQAVAVKILFGEPTTAFNA